MAGFIVSNSFGRFNAKKKVFNATITDIPGVPTTVPFKDIVQGLPQDTNGYAGNNGWAYKKQLGKNSGESTNGSGRLTQAQADKYFEWSGGSPTNENTMNLYAGDAYHFRPAPGTIAKFQFKYVTNKGSSNQYPYDYVVNIKKSGLSIPSAATSTSYPSITNYTRVDTTSSSSGYAKFTVEFDGDDSSNYFSIDMGDPQVGGIAACKFYTPDGFFTRDQYPSDKDIDRVEIHLWSIKKKPVSGCTDPQADNHNVNATVSDNSCSYTTATISAFSTSPTTITQGGSSTISWTLSNGNFSEVKLLENGTNIMPTNKKQAQSSSLVVSPATVGNNTYQLQVDWTKPNTEIRNSAVQTINVNAPTSYIPCTDPNRDTDGNGECASCKSGYYLGSDGLCTQCSDPNRQYDTDGRCGDCESGYSLGTNGLCQKSGCMDEDDANYDPDAVIDDSSACYGEEDPVDIDCELSDWSDWSAWSDADTDSGTRTRTRTVITAASGNGAVCEHLEEEETKDPDTGEVIITTLGGGTTTTTTTEEKSPNLLVPILLGGAILGGVLLLRK